MGLGILFKRAAYRELRNYLGYYDARKIIRLIDETNGISDFNDVQKVLAETGLDDRQIKLTVRVLKKELHLYHTGKGSKTRRTINPAR